MNKLATVIQNPHGLGNGVARARKTAGNGNAGAVKCDFGKRKLLKEAMEVARSVGGKVEKFGGHGFMNAGRLVTTITSFPDKCLQFWLQERIQRDCKRLSSLRDSEVEFTASGVRIVYKQGRLR